MRSNVARKILTRPDEEGKVTQMIEKQTAKIPSSGFLAMAVGSILISLGLKSRGRDTVANFVGLWTPTILLLGIYNKLVKLEGSDRRRW